MKLLIYSLLFLIGISASAQEVFNLQTFKCFTDDYEPGLYYQVTFGSDTEGKLATTDFRSYGENINTGKKHNEKIFKSISAQILNDGTFYFKADDPNGLVNVELKIKRLNTEIKWPLMTGDVKHDDFNSLVTCAYIGVTP